MIVDPITPLVMRMPKSMVAVKPTIPKAAMVRITGKSERRARAKRSVANHTKGASTIAAITILKQEAVNTGKWAPMILLSGVALPNSAIPAIRLATVVVDADCGSDAIPK